MFKKLVAIVALLFCCSCNAFCKYCDILDARKWFSGFYEEKCIFSNHHQKWEEKNCKFRLIKVDPDAKFHPLEEEKEKKAS
jgi:hypothetical protein